MDRFKEIEENIDMAEYAGMVTGDEQWMRQEIKRLRRIEDAALDWHQCRTHGEGVSRHCSTVAALRSAVRENPRPEEA